jgi:hypothetical protein
MRQERDDEMLDREILDRINVVGESVVRLETKVDSIQAWQKRCDHHEQRLQSLELDSFADKRSRKLGYWLVGLGVPTVTAVIVALITTAA